jgi:hypothetical protein
MEEKEKITSLLMIKLKTMSQKGKKVKKTADNNADQVNPNKGTPGVNVTFQKAKSHTALQKRKELEKKEISEIKNHRAKEENA